MADRYLLRPGPPKSQAVRDAAAENLRLVLRREAVPSLRKPKSHATSSPKGPCCPAVTSLALKRSRTNDG